MSRPLLLSCEAVSKAYGTRALFEELSLGLFEGDQVGLVGPNGSGKSTLLKILAGLEAPDRGTRSVRGGVRVGYVPQDPVFAPGGTVEDVLVGALAGVDEADRPGRLALALGRGGFRRRPRPGRARCRGGGASAWPSPRRSPPPPTSCCSTSPPTTSTWTASSGSRRRSSTRRAPSSW